MKLSSLAVCLGLTLCSLLGGIAGAPAVATSVPSVVRAEPPQVEAPDLKNMPLFDVVSIADGDTITLSPTSGNDEPKIKVRLVGVDTPETSDPRKPVEEFGVEASAFLHNLLLGERVYAEEAGGANKTDKYGRRLYYVYHAPDGMFVNLEIVRQGYGHALVEYPHRHMEAFKWYEGKARDAGKGLWGKKPATPKTSPAAVPVPVPVPVPAVPSPAVNDPKPTTKDPAPPEKQSVTVYGTKTGSKYHRAGCSYLKSSIPMSLEDAKRKGLSPCSRCNPPN